jgi:CheY-like chemotaxis protein
MAAKRAKVASYVELFESAPVGYAVLDAGGTIRELNRVAARLLGKPRGRLVGKPLASVVDGDVSALLDPARRRCDVTLRSGTAVRAIAGALPRGRGVAVVLHDGPSSHELRGLLAPITTSLFVLARTDGERARAALEVIARQVAQLRRLADEPRVERSAATSRRVLVIEDNPSTGESLRDALALIGHVARLAPDGPSGIELARGFRPEVVLCDLGLPGMDGCAVARALRADAALKGSYLVALTGLVQPEDLRRATRAGFDRHVAKPADLAVLSRVLAEVP